MSAPGANYEGPRHPRDEARDEIRKALRASFPDNGESLGVVLDDYVESLCLIAEAFEIPIDCLRFWIQDKPTGKDFSLQAWRRWCVRYATARDLLPAEAVAQQPVPPSITCPKCGRTSYNPNDIEQRYCGHCHEFQPSNLLEAGRRCTHCYDPVIQQIDGGWWCPRCGELQSA